VKSRFAATATLACALALAMSLPAAVAGQDRY